MCRRLLLAGVALLLASFACAQVECDVTKRLDRGAFVSAFRGAYLDIYDDNRGFNLAKEGREVYERAEWNIMNNRGGTCQQRYKYTLDLCLVCARQLGWRADSAMFRGNRNRQRRFVNDLRRRVCEDEDACTRGPRPSPSPVPSPLVKIVASDRAVSPVVAYRFALVSELVEGETGGVEFSTRLTYSVEDLVTGFGAFGDTIVDARSAVLDSEFFECAANMLDRTGLSDLAAAAVQETCYDESSGANFNNGCANQRLVGEICDGLRARGCAPVGDSLNSQCVL